MHGSIHIKVEYPEAVESKKGMLLLEKSMLETVSHIRNYDSLRKKEFVIKNQIRRDFADIANAISSIESHMPKEEASFTKDSYKKEIKIKEVAMKIKKKQVEQKRNEIQDQLENIRNELARLG